MDGTENPSRKTLSIAAIVSTGCTLIGTTLKFSDAFPAWEPWITWTVGLMALITSGLVIWRIGITAGPPLYRFVRNFYPNVMEGADGREQEDWLRLQSALVELAGISRSVSEVIDAGVLDMRKPGHVARTLLKAVLIRAQRAVEKLCPDVVCSIKLVKRAADGSLSLECLYVDGGTSARYDAFVKRFKRIRYHNSYSGRALDQNEFVFVPNLWGKEAGAHPFTRNDAADLEDGGVQGLVVVPVSLPNRDGNQEAKFVFKVDFFVIEGLVDNPPTRRMLEMIAGFCGIVFHFALTKGASVDVEAQEGASDEAN